MGTGDRHFKEFLEIFIVFLVLVASFVPLGDGFTVEDEDVEECVKEEDVQFDQDTIQ